MVRASAWHVMRWGTAAVVLLLSGSGAFAADMPEGMAQQGRHRLHRHPSHARVEPVAPPSEYYERPLYQGPAFFYRSYYGSGPSLQWFSFGLGRDKDGYP